jgi:para-nitrobenzyl esterase
LLSPGAAGLFQRAIIESWPQATFPTEAVALQRGEAFAAAAGCPGTGASAAECLRQLSAARVLQLQGTPNANGPYLIEHFVDGNVIAVQPGVGFATGAYNKMPIMTGSVKDENTFFLMIPEYFSGPPQVALTPAQYLANNSAAVLAQYPLSNYGGNPTLAQDRVGTDPIKCVTLQGLTQIASTNTYGTYGYDFTYRGAPSYFPQMPNAYDPTGHFQALAYHTSDIQFLFPGYHGGNLGVNLDQASGQPRNLQGAEVTLSDQLVAAWTNFAKTGNPNGTGVPVWPVFTTGSPVFLQEDIPNGLETEAQYVANYKCDFWGF